MTNTTDIIDAVYNTVEKKTDQLYNILDFFGAMLRNQYRGNYAEMLREFKYNHTGNVTATWWDVYGMDVDDVLSYVLDDDEYMIYEALDSDVERTVSLLDSGKYIIIESFDPRDIGKEIFEAQGNSVDEAMDDFIDYEKIAVTYEERGLVGYLENGYAFYVWDK